MKKRVEETKCSGSLSKSPQHAELGQLEFKDIELGLALSCG